MKVKRITIVTFATIIVFCISLRMSLLVFAQGMPPANVRVKTVEQVETASRRVVTGSLKALQRAEVAGQEAGLVEVFDLREGQAVEAGDVIAVLDKRRVELEYKGAELEVKLADSAVRQAQLELDNYQEELDRRLKAREIAKGAVSEEDIRRARKNKDVAETSLQAARHEAGMADMRLELLKERLDDMIIRAPFSGSIVKKHIEVGEWVRSGDPIVTLVSTGELEAVLEIPEQVPMDALRNAGSIRIQIDSLGIAIDTDRIQVIPDVDPRSRRFMLTAIIDPDGKALAPGMSVTATIPTRELKEYKLVPADAILKDEGGAFVYKVVPSSQGGTVALPVSLRLLFAIDSHFAVESRDLQAGDQLVVEGNERLRPMSPISVMSEQGE